MLTIKTLKDRIREAYPYLSDDDIEKAKILLNDRVLSHYIKEERVGEPERSVHGEYRISINIENL